MNSCTFDKIKMPKSILYMAQLLLLVSLRPSEALYFMGDFILTYIIL